MIGSAMALAVFLLGFSYCNVARADSSIIRRPVPLVTGCGRGGTHTTAAMLAAIGVHAVHEDFVTNGVSVSWPYGAHLNDGESCGFEWEPKGRYPWEKMQSYKDRIATLSRFSPVVLLVRDPLQVISSTRRCFCARGGRTTENSIKADLRSWLFVEHFLNLTEFINDRGPTGEELQWSDLPLDNLRRSMVYWFGWNSLVEKTYVYLPSTYMSTLNFYGYYFLQLFPF